MVYTLMERLVELLGGLYVNGKVGGVVGWFIR